MLARRQILATLLLAALALLGAIGAAQAIRPSKSIYTALDLAHCADMPVADGRRVKRCEGLEGFPLFVTEAELRYYLSVGTNGEARRAAMQTLAPLNTLFGGKSRRTTIEWRFIIRDDRPVPYAMIVRYFTKQGKKRGQVLVVTRVSDTDACHVAYIDAVANPNAIMLARRIADERARAFDCKSDPVRAGITGMSPM